MMAIALQLVFVAVLWLCPVPLCVWLASKDSRRHRFGHDLLVVLVGVASCQMLLPLVLGSAHLLRPPSLYALELAVALLGLSLLWRAPGRQLDWWPATVPTAWQAGSLFLGTFVACVSFWRLLEAPTHNYDSFAYHLPAIVWWAQAGRFEILPELGQTAYYAFNWELLSLHSIFALHSDLLVALPNLWIWSSFGLALVLLARDMGANSASATAAALLLLCSRAVLTRLDAAQPDIALGAFFVTALYFGRLACTTPSIPIAFTALLACLVVPGIKMSGWVYVAIAFLLWEFWRRAAGGSWRRLPRAACVAALTAGLCLGGFWYFRNLALTGNPLGFMRLELLGRALWDGELGPTELVRTTLLQCFDLDRSEHWRTLGTGLWDQLGPGFPVFVLVALLSNVRPPRRELWIGLLGAGLAWIAYVATPYSADNGEHGFRFTEWFVVNLRFAFPFFSLLAVLAALGLRNVPAPWLLLGTAGSILYVVSWELEIAATTAAWSAALAFTFCSALLVRRKPANSPAMGIRLAGVLGAACLLGGLQLPAQLRLRERLRVEDYGLVHEFMERELPADAVIGYAGTHRIFPLFGNRLSRQVVGVEPPAKMTSVEWLAKLRERNVQYLALGGAAASAREYIASHADRFELLFPAQSQLKDVELYRVR